MLERVGLNFFRDLLELREPREVRHGAHLLAQALAQAVLLPPKGGCGNRVGVKAFQPDCEILALRPRIEVVEDLQDAIGAGRQARLDMRDLPP